MKKVSILSLHLGYGGIEKSIVALANILVSKYDVEIACIYRIQEKEAFEVDEGVKIRYLIDSDIAKRLEDFKILLFNGDFVKLFKKIWTDYFRKGKIISFFKDAFSGVFMYFKRSNAMKKYLKKCDSDIIISTRVFLNDLLSQYGKSTAVKIGWEHNHYHDNMKYAIDVVRSAKKLDYFVLVSNNLYNFYDEKLKEYGCKCCFIPNIIDKMPERVSKLDQKRLVSVGRLAKEKGYLDLLKIYNLLVKDYSDWHLDIVGDGPERQSLEEYISNHNLKDKVTLHGFQNRDYIDNLLHNSSLYIMTSYTESFGIVLIEAMSHGLPCLAFDSAEGACELISSGNDGYLIKNRNFQVMLEKIEDLIEKKDQRIRIGKAAYETSMNYTSSVVGKKWFKLMEESDNNE